MKIERKKELLAKSIEDLKVELSSLKRILFNLRFKKARRNLEKSHLVRFVKREVAFVLTLIRQKSLS